MRSYVVIGSEFPDDRFRGFISRSFKYFSLTVMLRPSAVKYVSLSTGKQQQARGVGNWEAARTTTLTNCRTTCRPSHALTSAAPLTARNRQCPRKSSKGTTTGSCSSAHHRRCRGVDVVTHATLC